MSELNRGCHFDEFGCALTQTAICDSNEHEYSQYLLSDPRDIL